MSETKRSKLWIWIIVVFVVQIAVWAAWFTIAAKNKVEEVPLATSSPHR